MKRNLPFQFLKQLMPATLLLFGISTFSFSQTVYTQNLDGIVVINAYDYDTIRAVGTQSDTIVVADTGTAGFINDKYLAFEGVTNAYTTTAYSEAPAAYYKVNFTQTGTYELYAHMFMPSSSASSIWIAADSSSSLIKWQDWTSVSYGEWTWFSNDAGNSISIDTKGEHDIDIYERSQGGPRFDKFILVEDGTSFSPEDFIASADLSVIAVNNDTLDNFIASDTIYNIELPYGTTSFHVGAASYNPFAVVADTGTISGLSGEVLTDTTTISVTSEDGDSIKTYHLIYNVLGNDSDASLADLTIDGTTISDFSSTIYEYAIVLPVGTTSISVQADPTDDAATIPAADTGTYDMSSGKDTIAINVKAKDGVTIKTYTLYLSVYEQSSEATLSNLLIDGISVPDFDSLTTSYDVILNSDVTSVEVTATAYDDSASVSGTGTVDPTSNSTTTVTVTPEDGSITMTYTISFSFSSGTTTDTYEPTDNGVVDIEAELYTNNIVGLNYDAWSVAEDANYYNNAYVIAPALGSYGTYTNAETDAPRLEYQVNFASTGNHYVWAHVNFPDGDGDSFFYGLDDTIASGTDRVTFSDTYNTILWVEATNPIDVKTAGEHTLEIFAREKKSIIDRIIITTSASFDPEKYVSDSTLSLLTVDGDTIDGFASDSLTYTVQFTDGTTSATIGTETVNPNATVAIEGADAISADGGEITITVTSEDGNSSSVYTITYTVTESTGTAISSTSLEDLKVYPSPATTTLTISNVSGAEINIYSVQGILLKSEQGLNDQTVIDVSDLSPGLYVLSLKLNGEISNKSFIKQ